MRLDQQNISTTSGDAPRDPSAEVPLCVDLDGTLIATDSMWEAILLLAKNRPLDLLRAPMWLTQGRAYFKAELFQRVMPDPTLLPYRHDVLDMLRARKAEGTPLVLATGSDQRMAAAVCQHLELFDQFVASDGVTNMTSHRKLAELERRFGARRFDYAGNSSQDLCLWGAARESFIVSASGRVMRQAKALCQPKQTFEYPGNDLRAAIKALRPHQWVKNLLIFVPLVLAHQVRDVKRDIAVLFAFWAFSLSASAIYILNDLLDLEADRKHTRKRNRPFAAGRLSVPAGIVLALSLLIGAFLICIAEPLRFTQVLFLYLIVTTAYSFWIKRKLLVDVMVLAGLYTLRIKAGSEAAQVPLTMWLMAFSMFLFLSLAFAKRYAELLEVEGAGGATVSGRGYHVADLRIIESVGPASGYLAVMVFCNYLDSSLVRSLYPHPNYLWLIAPILLYWITRVWFIARRGALDQDPIVFAIRDNISYVLGVLAGLVVLMASIHRHLPFLHH